MTEELDRDSTVPLYQQLEDVLTRRITSGEWEPDQRIPSENELNRIYGLSRMTVRGVLTKLVNDGLLRRVPGKGTFVRQSKISALSPAYRGIREQLEAMGLTTTTELLSFTKTAAIGAVRDQLQLPRGESVYQIVRLRSVHGEPISLHRSYVPSSLTPGLEDHDVVGEQLCVVLENAYGIRMQHVAEELEAVAAAGEDATALATAPGAPVLVLRDLIFDQNDRPFEFSRITFRGDRLRLQFTYDR